MDMIRYPTQVKDDEAKAAVISAQVSTKKSALLCRKIRGMNLQKAKAFLEDLIAKKRDIDGKHYTNTAIGLLELLRSAESNAEFKGLDKEKLKIRMITAEKGPTRRRRKRRRSFGSKLKSTHLKVVLSKV
ncbi:MAG: hypothetical protein DRP11_00825 [Candidatus Aenigmatarchaeota archaeon]|nr:MAG: hypothetical protein DRP11_00825 [Candidatus Aenigmarchaeota archaeon]